MNLYPFAILMETGWVAQVRLERRPVGDMLRRDVKPPEPLVVWEADTVDDTETDALAWAQTSIEDAAIRMFQDVDR